MDKSVVLFDSSVSIPYSHSVRIIAWAELYYRNPKLYDAWGVPKTFYPIDVIIYDNSNKEFRNWLGLLRLSDKISFYSIQNEYLFNFFSVLKTIEDVKGSFGEDWWTIHKESIALIKELRLKQNNDFSQRSKLQNELNGLEKSIEENYNLYINTLESARIRDIMFNEKLVAAVDEQLCHLCGWL